MRSFRALRSQRGGRAGRSKTAATRRLRIVRVQQALPYPLPFTRPCQSKDVHFRGIACPCSCLCGRAYRAYLSCVSCAGAFAAPAHSPIVERWLRHYHDALVFGSVAYMELQSTRRALLGGPIDKYGGDYLLQHACYSQARSTTPKRGPDRHPHYVPPSTTPPFHSPSVQPQNRRRDARCLMRRSCGTRATRPARRLVSTSNVTSSTPRA